MNNDRGDAGAGKKRGDGAHDERDDKRAAILLADAEAARESREVDRDHVKHRQRERDEQDRDPEVEPGRRVDRAKRSRGENDDEAEDAVDRRHRSAVHAAKNEPAAA